MLFVSSYGAGRFYALYVFLFLACTTVLLTACEKQVTRDSPPPLVEYLPIQPENITLIRELPGRTSAFIVSDVRPQVSGIIQKRLFTEGGEVRAGDVLYQIDPAHYQAVYNKAKAALMEAEAEAVALRLQKERYERLVSQSAVSKQDYDNLISDLGRAEARVIAGNAELASAALDLDYTRVTAPVSGRIGRSAVTPGALVTQNQQEALATIQQLDPMYVDVTQSSLELLELQRALASGEIQSAGDDAMSLFLILENGETYKYKEEPRTGTDRQLRRDAAGKIIHESPPVVGRLAFSDVTVDPDMGVVNLRAIFPNQDGLLLPGMYVRLMLQEGIKESAILVPQKAVSRNSRGEPLAQLLVPEGASGSGLFTVENRVLTVDRAIDNRWLVTSGLKEGDLLMVEGKMKVRPGQSVKGIAIGSVSDSRDKNRNGES